MVTTKRVPGSRAGRALTARALLVVVLLAGCGGGGAPGGPVVVPTTTPVPTVTTTVTEPGPTTSVTVTPAPTRATDPAASALPQLRGFVAAVRLADARLRGAAVLVNGGVRDDRLVLTDATVDAVEALDTHALARLLPAGTPAPLARSALGLVAGLNSRERAFARVPEYAAGSPLARDSEQARDLVRCLGNGAAPAHRFAAELADLRALAARTPAFTVRPASSRAAADLAVRGAYAWLRNAGCDECGGYAPHPMPVVAVVWGPTTEPMTGARWDGTVDGIAFRATYSPRTGWAVQINAC